MEFNVEGLSNLNNQINVANQDVNKRIVVNRISLDELHEHDDNFYDISGLEALVEELKTTEGELLNPIKVKKDNTIISGHRRYNAFKEIAKTDNRYNTIPVIYIDDFKSEEEELLFLITENSQRIKSKEELAYEIQLKKKLYSKLKEQGDINYVNVNINKLLAEEFSMSESSIKRATGNASVSKPKLNSDVVFLENSLQQILKTKTVITGNEKGFLKIKFDSPEKLNELLIQMNLISDEGNV